MFQIGYNIFITRFGLYIHNSFLLTKEKLHSEIVVNHLSKGITLHILPILDDNFCYLIVEEDSKIVVAVDASDGPFIIKYLEKNNSELTHILTTHKHWDHAGK